MVLPQAVENLICVLKECRKSKSLASAKSVQGQIIYNEMGDYKTVGNYLVPMLAECGSIIYAQEAFNKLSYLNEHCWTSLILGYIECGLLLHALSLYTKMQENGTQPSSYTITSVLKACTILRVVESGREIHAEIVRSVFKSDLYVMNNLINMYSRCGSLAEAQMVLDRLSVRDAASWDALIVGYVENRLDLEALKCFEYMQQEGMLPNTTTYVYSLKACGSIGNADKVQQIHTEIFRKDLGTDLFLCNALIDAYGKCGLVLEAQKAFDKLPVQDVVSWTILIGVYAENELHKDALKCFEQMQLMGISPDAVTFVYGLKACANLGAKENGHEIHIQVAQKGLEGNIFVVSALIHMYAKFGLLAEAQEVFYKLPIRNVISWTALIAGYADHGLEQEALRCFEEMQMEGVPPNAVTFVCVLNACANLRAIGKGQEIHTKVNLQGFGGDHLVGNALIDMYAKCGKLVEAQQVLNKLPVRGVVSWTTLVAGYADNGLGEEALKCFDQMKQHGVSPNHVTYICCLKACISIGALNKGRAIHKEIIRVGYETDLSVGNVLVNMYAKCHCLEQAQEVFDNMPARDVISWNTLIAGYVENGLCLQALKCFKQMHQQGLSPNDVTYLWSLKACSNVGAINKGREMHIQLTQKGFNTNCFVGSAVIDMYVKCGSLSEARKAFDKLPVRDVVSWNALIAGYAENGHGEDALDCFKYMQAEGVAPNVVTYICILKGCASLGAIGKGREIHAEIVQKGIEREGLIGNSLVDMYAKCGLLLEAREIFTTLPVWNIVSWNAMIRGYAIADDVNMAVQCFESMQEHGVTPDAITFICLLSACSRASLVMKGLHFFKLIEETYNSAPTVDHYNCLVDLFARSGHLYEADRLLVSAANSLDRVAWTALLSACKIYGDAELGHKSFQQLCKMIPESTASYTLMANICASSWEETWQWDKAKK